MHYLVVRRFWPLAALALVGAACGSAATSSGTVVARSGFLEVSGAYLPKPASPDIAAAYLTVKNNGTAPDTLIGVDSPAAAQALPMTSGDGPDGAGRGQSSDPSSGVMAPLPSLVVPPHGSATFAPGGDHLMLEGLTRRLAVGQTVVVDLHFAHAGLVSVPIPVVPLDRILGSGGG